MSALLELQRQFRGALLDARQPPPASIRADGIDPKLRFDIYRNNVFASLGAVLRDTYPVVLRLVGAGFFDYAAHTFVSSCPPRAACLHEYGAGLADFLSNFPACRHLVYLPDVARLEWLLHRGAYAPELPHPDAARLAALAPGIAATLRLRFQPAVALLQSAWPVDRIWVVNQGGGDEEIDLNAAGDATVQIARRDGIVGFSTLGRAEFEFRLGLSHGETLAAAQARGLAADADFDAGAAWAGLLAEEILAE